MFTGRSSIISETIVRPGEANILLVDDDPVVTKLVSGMLAGLGNLLHAHSGREALELVVRQPPDIVLLDMGMPDMDGLTVCRHLTTDRRTAHIPIIFLTARDRQEDEVEGLRAGAVDFVHKPPSGPILRARVAAHLRAKSLTDEIRLTAAQDPLTRVANKRELELTLQQAWSNAPPGSPLSVVMIDVDHFKQYNDTYGHPAGDECLLSLTEILANACRSGDVLGRFGGDEFLLVLPGADATAAAKLSDRLVAAVAAHAIPHSASPTTEHLTISVGTATCSPRDADPRDGILGPADLVRAADQALLGAKRSGRNRAEGHGTSTDGRRSA